MRLFFCQLFIVFYAVKSVPKDEWELKFKVDDAPDAKTQKSINFFYYLETDTANTSFCYFAQAYGRYSGRVETFTVEVPRACRNVTIMKIGHNICEDRGHLQWVELTNFETSKEYDIKCPPTLCATCVNETSTYLAKVPIYQLRSKSCPPDHFGVRSCNKKCHCLKNAECTEYNGYCPGDCSSGYTGSNCQTACPTHNYGISCRKICGKCAGRRCDPDTGICPDGCQIGHINKMCEPCKNSRYGVNCVKRCHCYNNYACDTMTGSCGRYGCELSWHGNNACDKQSRCRTGFYGKACVPCGHCREGICHVFTGHCPRSKCKPNFFGSRCDACAPKMYGLLCDKVCGKCHNGKPCNSFTGACPKNHCAPGYSSTKCDMKCEKSYFGPNCKFHCRHCVDEDCLADTGKCNQGCMPGWEGELCNVTDKRSDCDPGFYLIDCAIKCGECTSSVSCHQYPGTCPMGCKNNYNGIYCAMCPDGFFGLKCSEVCGNCKDGNTCEATGKCTNGCLNQFVEPNCLECVSGYFGPECDQPCGHCRLKDTCDPHSGACPNGCADGFTGHFCKQRLPKIQVFDKF